MAGTLKLEIVTPDGTAYSEDVEMVMLPGVAGLLVMILVYLITQEDTAATLIGSILAVIGVTIGLGLALIAWKISVVAETSAARHFVRQLKLRE